MVTAGRPGFREWSLWGQGRESGCGRGQRAVRREKGRAGSGGAGWPGGVVGTAQRVGTERQRWEERGEREGAPRGLRGAMERGNCPENAASGPRLPAGPTARLRHLPLLGDAVNIRPVETRGARSGRAAVARGPGAVSARWRHRLSDE